MVVSVSFVTYSSDMSKRIETSNTIASFNTSILKYNLVIKIEEANPDGQIMFTQRNDDMQR